MANEELIQRGYLSTGKIKGEIFGDFESLNIGATTVKELASAGICFAAPIKVPFPFKYASSAESVG